MADPFIAEIIMFGGSFAPRGWAYCNGQLLPISQNSALFSILGTTYGGDGRTSFGLPDLRGRVPIHSGGNSPGPGLSSYRLGQRAGAQTVTLNITQIPSHNHPVAPPCTTAEGDQDEPPGNVMATPSATAPPLIYHDTLETGETMQSFDTSNQGGGQAHTNIQPYLAINFIIALQGTFPSRN